MPTQCANCGFTNAPNFKFCSNCGAVLNADSARAPALERLGRLGAIPSALATQCPPVLTFEDIHRTDKISLDLLCFLIASLTRQPVLIYCSSRPREGGAVPKILELGKGDAQAAILHIALAPYRTQIAWR